MSIPKFSPEQLEGIAHCLADARTHRQLTHTFARLGIAATSDGPKWFRIQEALSARQARDGVGNNVGALIQALMAPVNFVNDKDQFDSLRIALNKTLAFSGIQLDATGKLVAVAAARTLDEAEARASELRAKLLQRSVHAEVLRFCRPELLDGNYFHAILEATKSVADKIRQKTGLTADAAELVQRAFCGRSPLLAVNTLQTETQRSEQSGFGNLLIGLFGTFRNPTAHAPKIQWPVSEQDALDLLSLVSYIHRRLDAAARTHHSIP